MAEISRYLINQISKSINNDLKSRCFKYLVEYYEEQSDAVFEEFLINFINDNIPENIKEVDLRLLKTDTLRNLNKAKKRWYETTEDEIKNFNIENCQSQIYPEKSLGHELQLAYNLLKSYGVESFRKIYEVNNIDEFINKRRNEFRDWYKSSDKLITDFRYYESKAPYQIERALKMDLLLAVSVIVLKDYGGQFNNSLIDRADALIDNPIFSDKKTTLKFGKWVEPQNKEEENFYNDYIVDEEYILRTIISNNSKNNIEVVQSFALDERDSIMVDYIVSKIEDTFLKDKKVYVDIGELVQILYPSRSGDCYEDVEKRLLKLNNYQISGILKKDGKVKDTKFSLNLFQFVVIGSEENSRKQTATITFSDALHQQYIDKQTVRVYKNHMKSFSMPLSKIIIYCLQKERINCYTSKSSYKQTYSYLWFRNRVRFRDKKKECIQSINESLEEYRNKGIIIKDFKQIKDSFEIEFLPLTSYEEYDFFQTNSSIELEEIACSNDE